MAFFNFTSVDYSSQLCDIFSDNSLSLPEDEEEKKEEPIDTTYHANSDIAPPVAVDVIPEALENLFDNTVHQELDADKQHELCGYHLPLPVAQSIGTKQQQLEISDREFDEMINTKYIPKRMKLQKTPKVLKTILKINTVDISRLACFNKPK